MLTYCGDFTTLKKKKKLTYSETKDRKIISNDLKKMTRVYPPERLLCGSIMGIKRIISINPHKSSMKLHRYHDSLSTDEEMEV